MQSHGDYNILILNGATGARWAEQDSTAEIFVEPQRRRNLVWGEHRLVFLP